MPAKSKKQYNFMQMMTHSPSKKTTKGIGPSKTVAEKFIHETPATQRSRFAKKK